MTHESEPITDDQLDAYLDGTLSQGERDAFELRLRANPERAREARIAALVDGQLQRLFAPQVAPPLDRNRKNGAASVQHPASAGTPRFTNQEKERVTVERPALLARDWQKTIRIALIGIVAVVAWIAVTWQFNRRADDTPYFERQALVSVYKDVVTNGFEPYYECRDDARFAATFERRQGVPLRLTPLPHDRQMMGLSYAGGLSRETTAMLCRVEGQPVIVFVDRLEEDASIAVEKEDDELKIHRVSRDGLVFYEVTPFDLAKVIRYLVVADE